MLSSSQHLPLLYNDYFSPHQANAQQQSAYSWKWRTRFFCSFHRVSMLFIVVGHPKCSENTALIDYDAAVSKDKPHTYFSFLASFFKMSIYNLPTFVVVGCWARFIIFPGLCFCNRRLYANLRWEIYACKNSRTLTKGMRVVRSKQTTEYTRQISAS